MESGSSGAWAVVSRGPWQWQLNERGCVDWMDGWMDDAPVRIALLLVRRQGQLSFEVSFSSCGLACDTRSGPSAPRPRKQNSIHDSTTCWSVHILISPTLLQRVGALTPGQEETRRTRSPIFDSALRAAMA